MNTIPPNNTKTRRLYLRFSFENPPLFSGTSCHLNLFKTPHVRTYCTHSSHTPHPTDSNTNTHTVSTSLHTCHYLYDCYNPFYLQFWRTSNMNDEAVNMVSAHHHNDTLAGDRSQFFASVYASAPGRLVIPSAIITDHSAGSAGSEGSMSVQGTAAVEGRVASTSGMGLNAEQTTGMIHPPRCCEVPQAAFPSVTKGGGVTCGRSSERSATQTCRTTSSKSFQVYRSGISCLFFKAYRCMQYSPAVHQ